MSGILYFLVFSKIPSKPCFATRNEPAGTLQWKQPQNWSDVPDVLGGWVFAPHLLDHIVITWPGNVWFVAALLLAIASSLGLRAKAKPIGRIWPLGLVVAVGALILITVRFMSKGGDGNYFMAPIVLLCVLTLTALWRRLTLSLSKQVLVASLSLMALFQATYSFVSTAWGQPGTRVLDANFGLSCWDSRATGARILSAAKLNGVSSFLAAQSRETLTVGLMPGEFMWLPRRVEHLSSVLYSRPKYLETHAGFARYISLSGADFLVVPTERTSPLFNHFPIVPDILAQATSVVPVFEDESFKIYRIDELL